MTNKLTKEEIRNHALLIQQSMAIEGFQMPLDEVLQIVENVHASDEPDTISALVTKARNEKRSCYDVFAEHYKFKNAT